HPVLCRLRQGKGRRGPLVARLRGLRFEAFEEEKAEGGGADEGAGPVDALLRHGDTSSDRTFRHPEKHGDLARRSRSCPLFDRKARGGGKIAVLFRVFQATSCSLHAALLEWERKQQRRGKMTKKRANLRRVGAV